VVVENVSQKTAEEAADTVRDLFKRKRILTNVTVEAIILSDEMLEPYTYDWTIKMEGRARVKPQSAAIPHSIEELFNDETPETLDTATEKPVEDQRGRLRRMLSRARKWRHRKTSSATSSVVSAPQSVAAAFSRHMVTPDSERHLLDGLNERCRQRRRDMDEGDPSSSSDDEEDEDDGVEEAVSTLGDLPQIGGTQTAPSSVLFDRLNQVILSRSGDSSLVLLNLPDIWGTSQEDCVSYMAFCECLVRGLERVIFVHSAGHEVVQIF